MAISSTTGLPRRFDPRNDNNKYEYLNIKNFWIEYFRKRGADIQDYQYNDMSKLKQLLTSEEE